MFINNVEIKNYRGFTTFQTELLSTTLIVGENESGKSNFFSALSLPLCSNEISFSQKRLKVSDINTDSILTFYQAVIDSASMPELEKKAPIVSVKVDFTSPADEYEESLLHKWLSDDESGIIYSITYRFYPKKIDELIAAVRTQLSDISDINDVRWFTFPIEFYDYEIISTNNEKQISFNELKCVVINYIHAERDEFSENATMKANNLLTRMLVKSLKNSEKAEINSAYTAFFKAIEDTETFNKIIDPESKFENLSEYIESIECIPNLPNLKNILSNITLKTGRQFLYQRGLGERNLIYIIMLFEFFKLNEKYFNLCCIEEPEAHLGINNLRLATDFINKSTKTQSSLIQTLISTHNPSVINKLELPKVVVFSGDKAISLKDVSDELKEYLKKRPNFDTLKLLFADRLILVEGTTEEMLINSFFQKQSISLNRVEIISIGQKGFKTFLDIWLKINGLNSNKKIGVVRDFDDQQNAKDEHDEYDASNKNICVRTTKLYTLEDDLAVENHNLLVDLYELKECSDQETVAKHMKDGKANAMSLLCDAMLDEKSPVDIRLPIHIQEVITFVSS